jgi:hypothetical protein
VKRGSIGMSVAFIRCLYDLLALNYALLALTYYCNAEMSRPIGSIVCFRPLSIFGDF